MTKFSHLAISSFKFALREGVEQGASDRNGRSECPETSDRSIEGNHRCQDDYHTFDGVTHGVGHGCHFAEREESYLVVPKSHAGYLDICYMTI